MKQKIKNWLIRKLGGIVAKDLPLYMQMDILNYFSTHARDRDVANVLLSGFSTKNSHDN